jgi:hypothetical protein
VTGLLGTRTVRAGTAPGTVVRCSATDTLLSGLATSAVFVYQRGPDPAALEAGLATALAIVPVFAGRLRTGPDGGLEIGCDDTGAAFTVAELAETGPDALNRTALPTAGYADPVQAGPDRAPGAPLFAAKASRLADGGLVLGITWHHALGDLASVLLLMRAWSAAVEGAPAPDVRVDADRSALLPAGDRDFASFWLPSAEEGEELTRQLRAAAMANRIVQLWFAGAEVDRMRAAYGAAAGRALSANDVLAGHLVSTCRRVDGDHEPRRLTMPVNLRRRAGLPPGAVGNLVSELVLDCPADAGPAELAGLLRAAVEEGRLDTTANRAFLDAAGPDRRFEWMPLAFDPARKTFSLRNWGRAGAYEVRFGGPPPVFFGPEVPVPAPWAGWICEGFGGEGWLVTVVLPARLAGRVRADPGLHAFREAADAPPPVARGVRKLG